MKVVFIEQDRCLACRNCERVCSFQDTGGFKREHSNIWVQVDMQERAFFTLTCQQCETASCLRVCPPGALRRDPVTEAVVVDETLCVGCRMCVMACPFGCIQFEERRHVATKCNLCNGDPKCVQNCMAGALHFGEINRLAGIKRKKIDKRLVRTTISSRGERGP